MQLRLFGEVVFLLFWLYYLQKEVRTLVYHKPFLLYFTKFRNLFEVLFLGFNLAVIITWLQFVSDPLKANFTVEATEFMDMFPLAERFMTAYTLAGFIGLMAWCVQHCVSLSWRLHLTFVFVLTA